MILRSFWDTINKIPVLYSFQEKKYGSYLQQALPSESGSRDDRLQYVLDSVICVEDSAAPVLIHTARRGLFKADFVIITGGRKTARVPSSCQSYRDTVPVFPSPL